jgi:hypothetical protein
VAVIFTRFFAARFVFILGICGLQRRGHPGCATPAPVPPSAR